MQLKTTAAYSKAMENSVNKTLKRISRKDLTIPEKEIREILEGIKEKKTKNKIKNFFLFTLNNYIEKLIAIEKSISYKKSEELWKELRKYNFDILRIGDKIVSEIRNRIIVKRIKEKFRMFLSFSTYQGKLVKRAYKKPRGYPGDYKMLEGIYNNKAWTKKGIGHLWDKILLNDEYVKSVRYRKDHMKKILEQFLKEKTTEVNITNLGCGSAREVRELFSQGLEYKKRINFTLVDQDEKALNYARSQIEKLYVPVLKCNYLKENLITFDRKVKIYRDKFGKQDLIYSIGVFDYLPDEFCKNIIRAAFVLLKKHGKFIIAYKLVKQFKSLGSDWFCDWNFYPRNDLDVTQLIKESLKNNKYKLIFINSFQI